MMKCLCSGVVVIVAMAGISGPRLARAGDILGTPYSDREERIFKVSGTPQLRITTLRTSVEVRGWDRAEIRIVLERQAHDRNAAVALAWHAEQQGQSISVDVRRPFGADHPFTWNQAVDARLIVSLPFSTALDLRTGAGSIEIMHVSGQSSFHTTSGNITINGVLTAVDARSRSGSISIRAQPGSTAVHAWDVETLRGAILVECADALKAEVRALAKTGHVRMEGVARSGTGHGLLRLSTRSGSITVRTAQPAGKT